MKWGLQHVKVTLEEEDSGETVVIEQNSDGRVTCERGGRGERAANSAPKAKVEVKVKTPEKPEPEAPAAKPEKTGNKASRPARAKKAKTPRKPEPKSASTRLEWRPIRDFTFDGFAAESGPGMSKALHTRENQWALFFEVKGLGAKKIACFTALQPAKDRAQALHAKGPSEFAPLSASRIEEACPVPPRAETPAEPKKTPPPAEPPKAAPKAEPPPASPTPRASETHAAQDKELLGSFGAELEAVLDEDEDD